MDIRYRRKLTPEQLQELKRMTKEQMGDQPYTVLKYVRTMEHLYIKLHGRQESHRQDTSENL